jgi:leucyl aminopeptidase
VIGILSSAENHISESAYRPGDIIRIYNSVWLSDDTGAEERLVLGDTMWGLDVQTRRLSIWRR